MRNREEVVAAVSRAIRNAGPNANDWGRPFVAAFEAAGLLTFESAPKTKVERVARILGYEVPRLIVACGVAFTTYCVCRWFGDSDLVTGLWTGGAGVFCWHLWRRV